MAIPVRKTFWPGKFPRTQGEEKVLTKSAIFFIHALGNSRDETEIKIDQINDIMYGFESAGGKVAIVVTGGSFQKTLMKMELWTDGSNGRCSWRTIDELLYEIEVVTLG